MTEDAGEDGTHWKTCVVGGEERRIDMKVIEPYKKVLSHRGELEILKNILLFPTFSYSPIICI